MIPNKCLSGVLGALAMATLGGTLTATLTGCTEAAPSLSKLNALLSDLSGYWVVQGENQPTLIRDRGIHALYAYEDTEVRSEPVARIKATRRGRFVLELVHADLFPGMDGDKSEIELKRKSDSELEI